METQSVIRLRCLVGLIGLLWCVGMSGWAQPFADKGTSIQRMGNENVVNFDAGWLFKRYGLQAEGTLLAEPEGLEKSTVDDTDWQSLDLPHDWAIEGPFRLDLAGETAKLPYQGIGWYRKHFRIEPQEGERCYIDFDGAMANAKVWLNGHYVGTWPFGYNSFRLDLTPYIQSGEENILAVRLDTENWDSRWYSGAGIYRHVWLVTTQSVHVSHWGTYITTPHVSDREAEIRMEVKVDNHRPLPVQARLLTRFYELDSLDRLGQEVAVWCDTLPIHAHGRARTESTIRIAEPKRWDILSPNRYVARTEVYVDGHCQDTYHTPFGIRTLSFSAQDGFRLNGRRVPIQGVCLHHDLGSLGAAFNKSALHRQLCMLREMGCCVL